jgi:hypothetical protein
MITRDTAALYVGGAFLIALAILVVSVPLSLIAFWQASSCRASPGRRWEVMARARWVGSNARAMDLLTTEGQGRLRQAIAWQRISIAGIGLIVLAVLLGVLVGI